MPELPEVEAVVRKLRQEAVGAVISGAVVFRPRTTYPQPPDKLEEVVGRTIRAVERRGKNIVVSFDADLALRIHLRMTGNLYVIPDASLRRHTVRALLTFEDRRAMVFDDPRVLGTMHVHSAEELEEKLACVGVDPLSRAFTRQRFVEAARASRRPVKLFLMDQSPICGLGNIYAAEALFRARIHPGKPAGKLRAAKLADLHAAIRKVLREAIPAAIRSYRTPGDHAGVEYFVYARMGEPCRVCDRNIRRIAQAGRSTYFCPHCQRA
jgi:formamidopyrimidine-DNA glycosylase